MIVGYIALEFMISNLQIQVHDTMLNKCLAIAMVIGEILIYMIRFQEKLLIKFLPCQLPQLRMAKM
jgi:hypothetical protein